MISKRVSALKKKTNPEPGLLPQLRFPDFTQSGAWDFKPLKALAKRRSKRNAGEAIVRVLTNSAERGIVDQRDYFDKDIAMKGNLEAYFIVAEGDYVYNPRVSNLAPVGPIQKNKIGTGVMSPLYTVFRFDNDSNEFYEHYFRSAHWHNYLRLASNTGARHDRMAIANGDFFEMPLPAPDLAEQKKIAEFLSSLDALIAAEADKLDALKDHKKGLMQQVFPRAGEAQSSVRFSTDSDWTVVALPDVAFFQEGPGIMAVDFRSEGVPLVRLSGVGGASVTLQGCNYLDPEKVEQKWSHFRLALNDIVISTSASFGLSSIVTEAASGAVFYTGLIRFRPSSERLNHSYLKAFLGSPYFARQAEAAAVGGGIKHFGPTHLKQMKIPIPPLAEQQHIAECLSKLDALILAQADKLAALLDHQRGLIQKLFPSQSEVGE